jgi:hypothetical protein
MQTIPILPQRHRVNKRFAIFPKAPDKKRKNPLSEKHDKNRQAEFYPRLTVKRRKSSMACEKGKSSAAL